MTARQLTIFDAMAVVVSHPSFDKPSQKVASIPTPPQSGRVLRDEAIKRVADNADAGWMERAENILRALCCESGRETLTTDDIWAKLGDDEPREPRAMGAVLRRGCSLGIIEATDRFEQSKRAKNHARKIQVWRCF